MEEGWTVKRAEIGEEIGEQGELKQRLSAARQEKYEVLTYQW